MKTYDQPALDFSPIPSWVQELCDYDCLYDHHDNYEYSIGGFGKMRFLKENHICVVTIGNETNLFADYDDALVHVLKALVARSYNTPGDLIHLTY